MQTPWYQDPAIMAGIIGAVGGAIITGIISLYISQREQKKKRIDCSLGEVVSLLAMSDSIKKKIHITLENNQPVSSVFLFPLEIINSGDLAIRNQPVFIQLAQGAKIIDHKIETEPKIGFGTMTTTINNNVFELQIELLNPKERVKIEVVSVDNPSDEIEVGLKNENVQTRIYKENSVENTLLSLSLSNDMPLLTLSVLGEFPIIGSVFRPFLNLELARRLENSVKSKK